MTSATRKALVETYGILLREGWDEPFDEVAQAPSQERLGGENPVDPNALPPSHEEEIGYRRIRVISYRIRRRSRFVDPLSSGREYSEEELEFMRAMQEYKVASGRMFPTWHEVLHVLHALGYQRPSGAARGSSIEHISTSVSAPPGSGS
jgi:hypothetical protein